MEQNSVCRTKQFWGICFNDRNTNSPYEGDYLLGEAILRFHNGYLHSRLENGNIIPAVEFPDFHMEYYYEGKLHREEKAAISSDYGSIKEYWENGELIKVETFE